MFDSVFPAAAGTSVEEISVVEEKMKDNPFVKLQQHFSSYHKINKDTVNSREYINPVQLFTLEFCRQGVPIPLCIDC
jgi:hypothetical protein